MSVSTQARSNAQAQSGTHVQVSTQAWPKSLSQEADWIVKLGTHRGGHAARAAASGTGRAEDQNTPIQ